MNECKMQGKMRKERKRIKMWIFLVKSKIKKNEWKKNEWKEKV